MEDDNEKPTLDKYLDAGTNPEHKKMLNINKSLKDMYNTDKLYENLNNNLENIGVKFDSITLNEIRSMTDDDLALVLSGESKHGNLASSVYLSVTNELSRRRNEESQKELIEEIRKAGQDHWSANPTFWLVVVSVIIALIAL